MRSTSLITADRHIAKGLAYVSIREIGVSRPEQDRAGASVDSAAASVPLPTSALPSFGDVVLTRVA